MADDGSVFALVDRLVAGRTSNLASIGALAQAKLVADGTQSTPFFTIYTGTLLPGRPFADIELRMSVDPGIAKGMILLSRNAGACVGSDAVTAQYGQDFALSPPLAESPPGSPVYQNYRRAWGALRFGFSPGDRGCLVSVVIDWAA